MTGPTGRSSQSLVREPIMWTVSTPPRGSTITVKREIDHTALSWPAPKAGLARYAIGFFVLCWLGAWAWGLVAVSGELSGADSKAPKLFLLFWLGGWIAGGGMAIFMLTRLCKPARGERLLVYHDRLVHDPGSVPFNPFAWGTADQRRLWSEMFKSRKEVEIPRHSAGEVRLERVGERLRLAIDHGADRREIGEILGEPEKEWLAGVLRDWRAA